MSRNFGHKTVRKLKKKMYENSDNSLKTEINKNYLRN